MIFKPHRLRSASVTGSGSVGADGLHGIDGTGATVGLSRADGFSSYGKSRRAGMLNMIRSETGVVSRRQGYTFQYAQNGIGGVFAFHSEAREVNFYITGDSMTVRDGEQSKSVPLPESFDNCRASQSSDCMYFMNGSCLFIYRVSDGRSYYIKSDGGTSVDGYYDMDGLIRMPTVFAGCTPSGVGQAYEPVNLLNPFVCEQFVADGSTNEYTVHFDIESRECVETFVKNQSGGWDNTASFYQGKRTVTFVYPPHKPYVEGEDNVRIIYKRAGFDKTAYKLAGCRCMTMFGVGGYKDRVFLSGCDKEPSSVFYSDMDDGLYFPDLNYLNVGSSGTEVAALAGEDTRLAVICSDCVYMVSGSSAGEDSSLAFKNDAKFLITGIFNTPKPIKFVLPQAFDNEVVYLTENGVAAITASGVLDERCCQIRSAYINAHLANENLNDCIMLTWGDFLVLSNRAGRLYLLDSKNYSVSGDEPFSYRQYDGYIWEGAAAKYMWVQEGQLWFSDGQNVYKYESGSMHDTDADGAYPIEAYWETPPIRCASFHRNKFFDLLGVWLAEVISPDGRAYDTDVRVLARFDNDDWREVYGYSGNMSAFGYSKICYPYFTYADRGKSFQVYRRLYHKRCKTLKLRFENSRPDQSFALGGFTAQYTIM